MKNCYKYIWKNMYIPLADTFPLLLIYMREDVKLIRQKMNNTKVSLCKEYQ